MDSLETFVGFADALLPTSITDPCGPIPDPSVLSTSRVGGALSMPLLAVFPTNPTHYCLRCLQGSYLRESTRSLPVASAGTASVLPHLATLLVNALLHAGRDALHQVLVVVLLVPADLKRRARLEMGERYSKKQSTTRKARTLFQRWRARFQSENAIPKGITRPRRQNHRLWGVPCKSGKIAL